MTPLPGRHQVRRAVVALALALAVAPRPAASQDSVREQIARMTFPELRFTPVEPRTEEVRGITVYFVHDDQLPLATVYATFRGGVRRFGRDYFAAASAVPSLLRTAGTLTLPSDSVDARIETLALAMSFGQGGGGASSWVNSLSGQLDEAVRLWSEMLREPRFDSAQVELWRGAELERVRRRRDDPHLARIQPLQPDHVRRPPCRLGDVPRRPRARRPGRREAAVRAPRGHLSRETWCWAFAGDVEWYRVSRVAGRDAGHMAFVLRQPPGRPCPGDPYRARGVSSIHKEIETERSRPRPLLRAATGRHPGLFRFPDRGTRSWAHRGSPAASQSRCGPGKGWPTGLPPCGPRPA